FREAGTPHRDAGAGSRSRRGVRPGRCGVAHPRAAGAVRLGGSRPLHARGHARVSLGGAFMLIYIDGELRSRETATISVFDHGLLYGDGVFEGIRVYNRRIFRLDAHLDRLYDSARAIALEIPLDHAEMAEAVRRTVRENRKEDGYIR